MPGVAARPMSLLRHPVIKSDKLVPRKRLCKMDPNATGTIACFNPVNFTMLIWNGQPNIVIVDMNGSVTGNIPTGVDMQPSDVLTQMMDHVSATITATQPNSGLWLPN